MNHFRTALLLLLLAGFACAHAQPLVKINVATSECDVTANANEPIFQFDAQGNVLINGTLTGTGCGTGGSTGGGSNATFTPFNPPPAPLSVSPGTIAAGSGSATYAYTAVYATDCSISKTAGTVSGSGTCPTLSVSGGSCTGAGSPATCSGSGTVTEPTSLAGTITSCSYTVKATCNPGAVVSSAAVTVTPTTGGTPACQNLAALGTGSGGTWSRVTSTSVKYADGTVANNVDATDYVKVWSYPGTSIAWPGNSGASVRPTASANMYLAEKFLVPTDGSVTSRPTWSWNGSGNGTNFSASISICPGDFGQAGTQLTPYCTVDMSSSSGGVGAIVSATQYGAYCSLKPGTTYYLNILPMAPLPTNNVSTTTCVSSCLPWTQRF